MRYSSLPYNLILAFVIFLGGQLLGAGHKINPNQQPPSEAPRLHLRAGDLEPLTQVEKQAPLADALTPDHPALRLVQFTGPIQDAWLNALHGCGLELVSYVPDYAYLVWGGAAGTSCLEGAAPVRWQGLYLPGYALHPSLALTTQGVKPAESPPQDVIIQIFETSETQDAIQRILDVALAVLRQPQSALGYRVLAVRVPSERLAELAALPGVVNIEPLPRYTRTDEVQGQIMAGNLNASGSQPSGTGYLAWLLAKGFPTNPEEYPIVDVTDDGIDDGSVTPIHPDFYQFGLETNPDRLIYNHNWTSDATANGLDGHGNLNASIVAGYNDKTGSAYTDDQGFHYGLGINPFGRVAGSKVFGSLGWDLDGDFNDLLAGTYTNGGRISTNSWGSSTSGQYTWDDQQYDSLVRDAVTGQPGNQEITIVFSAGNNGSSASTTGSPGNAKNVITVGAAENYRPTWLDGCLVGSSGADDARDIINFSSRGPTADGRKKPDLVAPGTHIQGAASQTTGYTGYGVCDKYHPVGQTLYAASSGTSHSAPAVAGAASLFYNYYQRQFSASPPSPAMVKAYLVNTTRYLNGVGANDTLPSNSQGYGEVFLKQAFDGVPRTLVDQQITLSESGQLYTVDARIFQPDQPVRVTLAWTDAPGTPYAAAYVNNLDLEVEINGQTYKGNVFSGAFSVTGGAADSLNNLESVFLPAGLGGSLRVRVRATNIAGDGVPGDDDLTDQDFALVIYNASEIIGVLQGTVNDSVTGVGLAGVQVQATSSSDWSYQITTDETGAYSLSLLGDTYTVSAWKSGYSQENATGVVVQNDLVTVQNFTLSPVDSYSLSGCIRDNLTSQGLGATVTVTGPLGGQIAQASTTRSDPCYNLELFAARYQVRAESLLHLPGVVQVDLTSDSVQDFNLAATTLDGVLRGQVTDYNTAQPLTDIRLYFTPPGAPYSPYQTMSNTDGAYEIQLPPDTYAVTTDKPFYTSLLAGDVVVPQSNIEQLDLALRSARLEITPSQPLRFDLQPREQANTTLILANTGSSPLAYQIYESSGGPLSGGPDPAGYVLLDSRINHGSHYSWIDASDGNHLAIYDDDEINVDLPFAFTYYGQESNFLRIGNNGAVLFGAQTGDVSYNNQPLSIGIDNLIAPYWDDLDADYGWVAYKTVGVAPQRRFVVEWFNRPHYSYGITGITFELILYEGSNNIKFQYQDVFFDSDFIDRGYSATVGIRGYGPAYLQFSYNEQSLANGLALCFQAPGSLPCEVEDLPWLTVTPTSGSLVPMDEQLLNISIDADQAGLGFFSGVVRLWGNDPLRQPYMDIPIRVFVHGNEVYLPITIDPH